VVRLSKMPNIFEIAARSGLVTAAAAYFWVSELYNACPYDPIEHQEVDDLSANIQHGRVYMADTFPDMALFAQAERLVRHYMPDYLLIHPMGMDDMGHHYGGESMEYANHAVFIDSLLAAVIPGWIEKGYSILVTADHGMNNNHNHGGSGDELRRVPLYFFRSEGKTNGGEHQPVSQLQIAPTVLKLLGLPIPESMLMPPLD
jgi:predicted AlkP superfamily pyrophosphatase or phosphodiesterase